MDAQTIKFSHGGASLKLERIKSDTYTIRNFWSRHRREGHGGTVLKQAIAFADDNELVLMLVAQRYGKGGMNDFQLQDFYHKHGFRKLTMRGPARMIRYPSQDLHTP